MFICYVISGFLSFTFFSFIIKDYKNRKWKSRVCWFWVFLWFLLCIYWTITLNVYFVFGIFIVIFARQLLVSFYRKQVFFCSFYITDDSIASFLCNFSSHFYCSFTFSVCNLWCTSAICIYTVCERVFTAR